MEVMVTLAIISLVVSIAIASLSTSMESARFSSLSKAAAAEMRNFRAKALLMGQSAIIVTDTADASKTGIENIWRLPLPDDWRTEGDAIGITPSGLCLGGQIRMISPSGRQALYEFSPPKCIPQRLVIPPSTTETL